MVSCRNVGILFRFYTGHRTIKFLICEKQLLIKGPKYAHNATSFENWHL